MSKFRDFEGILKVLTRFEGKLSQLDEGLEVEGGRGAGCRNIELHVSVRDLARASSRPCRARPQETVSSTHPRFGGAVMCGLWFCVALPDEGGNYFGLHGNARFGEKCWTMYSGVDWLALPGRAVFGVMGLVTDILGVFQWGGQVAVGALAEAGGLLGTAGVGAGAAGTVGGSSGAAAAAAAAARAAARAA